MTTATLTETQATRVLTTLLTDLRRREGAVLAELEMWNARALAADTSVEYDRCCAQANALEEQQGDLHSRIFGLAQRLECAA